MNDTTTPKPREQRHQGLQHISIPLAQAMDELLQRAQEAAAVDQAREEDAKEAQ